jgi:AcrR family transcriptional regulator
MGARSVFMSCGYGDANMDEVARTAKVSKATVYSYFPDKQRLFIEVVKAECQHMAEHAMDRIPELGRQFYENGPMMGRQHIAEYLRKAADAGEIEISDFELAADQFTELCKATLWPQAVFGIRSEFSDDEKQRVVSAAVETFCRAYAPQK